jgi:4-amino-4-deoxy-L-arabinose transferase-like glycosyltransferase
MKNKIRISFFTIFLLSSGILCLLYAIVFHPVTYEAKGDFPAYVGLARQIFDLPGAGTDDLSHRSPLYSVIMGFLMLVAGESVYLPLLMYLHYFLIFVTSILVYRLFFSITGNRSIAFTAGVAGVINLTTIFFGYIMISEILALFLFTLNVWLLIKGYFMGKIMFFSLAGLTCGLLILARYNTMGIPLVIIPAIGVVHLTRFGLKDLKKPLYEITAFSIALLLVLNLWSWYNLNENGYYGLMPRYHTGQRWAIPAVIDSSDKVSGEYKEVLAIFLKTREELLMKSGGAAVRKGSLLTNKGIRKINDFFRPEVSGYFMYRDSEGELLKYYKLEYSGANIRILNEKLKPFFESIASQHRKELRRFRIYSFLYSFKHISPTLPENSPSSLNALPSFVLKMYKILFIFLTLTTFGASLIHTGYLVCNRERLRSGSHWLILYMLIWYFPLSNWYASVLGDANRFRFPADSVIIGIFICCCAFLIQRIKKVNATGGSPPIES